MEKRCTKCGEIKPLEEFHRSRYSKDGHKSACGVCRLLALKSPPTGPQQITTVCADTDCGMKFTYTKHRGNPRMYCSERCKHRAADRKRQARATALVRACACGSTEVALVGKPVCPNCKVDKRDLEKQRARERLRTLRLYGLTPETFDAMLLRQGGKCAICRSDDPGAKRGWNIDHDHSCCPGKGSCGECVRGLLCLNCNLMVGHALDNPALLRRAAHYLELQIKLQDQSADSDHLFV